METKKKIRQAEEIDLIDILSIILKHKLKILPFMIIPFLFMMIYLSQQDPKVSFYEAMTEIRPISTFDEFEYDVYNDYLSNSGSKTVKYPIKVENERFMVNEVNMSLDNSSFKRIDKEYLINLFVEKINENKFLIYTMIEFGLLDKNNYKNNTEYKSAVTRLAESIKFLKKNVLNNDGDKYMQENSWLIKYRTSNVVKWEDYLKFLEDKTNNQINEYLNFTFNNLLLNQARIKKYKIEDIDYEILNSIDENKKTLLENNRNKLLTEKDIQRLKFSFNTTPIVNKKKFMAANILYEETEYKNISEKTTSASTMISLSIILGAIVGIFYVLILDAYQRRKKNSL